MDHKFLIQIEHQQQQRTTLTKKIIINRTKQKQKQTKKRLVYLLVFCLCLVFVAFGLEIVAVQVDAVDVLESVEHLGLGEHGVSFGLLDRVGKLDLAEAMPHQVKDSICGVYYAHGSVVEAVILFRLHELDHVLEVVDLTRHRVEFVQWDPFVFILDVLLDALADQIGVFVVFGRVEDNVVVAGDVYLYGVQREFERCAIVLTKADVHEEIGLIHVDHEYGMAEPGRPEVGLAAVGATREHIYIVTELLEEPRKEAV